MVSLFLLWESISESLAEVLRAIIPQVHPPLAILSASLTWPAEALLAKAEPDFFLSLQNVTANHRANDVIAAEDGPQVLVGRFMYGPLDMVALTGEKVLRARHPLSWLTCVRCTVRCEVFRELSCLSWEQRAGSHLAWAGQGHS